MLKKLSNKKSEHKRSELLERTAGIHCVKICEIECQMGSGPALTLRSLIYQ